MGNLNFLIYPRSKTKTIDFLTGKGGIRTHGDRKATPIFKIGAFNHSATFPKLFFKQFSLPF